jgi:endo-1,4-beta-xylanase
MTFSVSETAGTADTRKLTVIATNGHAGTAYATQLSGFTLTQTSGPSCTPRLTTGSTPAVLGDLAVGASASASFTVSIAGCNPNSHFTLSVPWSSAVYDTGAFVTSINFSRGK